MNRCIYIYIFVTYIEPILFTWFWHLCFVKAAILVYSFPHSHLYGLSPVCILRWRASEDDYKLGYILVLCISLKGRILYTYITKWLVAIHKCARMRLFSCMRSKVHCQSWSLNKLLSTANPLTMKRLFSCMYAFMSGKIRFSRECFATITPMTHKWWASANIQVGLSRTKVQ
jgi:hypothetical protein